MTPYKLKILNGVLKLKSFADVVLNIFGIKDLGTQTGNVSNGLVDWSIQHLTKTTAQWNADTTTILLKGQLGIEDTGNASYKVKIGNGTNLWSALSYVGGGAGGSQDLQSVTDLGATTTNAINTAGVTSDYLQLDTTATPTNAVGKIVWNDTSGTGEIGLKGGIINAKLAQDLYARVVNKVGSNLLKTGYKAVKVSSAQGQRLAINLAQANNDNNSADTIGIVAENIDNNQEGFIITFGQLTEINTTGNLQSETWNDGDVLYLSPTTAGAITNIKPDGSTGHIVVLGYVEYAHANHGKIFVKVMNGWELDELHNVYINQGTLANNNALIYESTTQLWKNKSIATALGYTPENSANKGNANGYAPLASDAKIDAAYLPAYVDEVLEYANLAAFPVTGASDKIYIALDTNKVYRWSGSTYIEVAANSGVWGAITGTITNQTDLQTALNNKQNSLGYTAENLANKGVANGYAPLNSSGKINSTFLPVREIPIQIGWITPALQPANSTTYYFGNPLGTPSTGNSNVVRRLTMPKTGRITALYSNWNNLTVSSNENNTIQIRNITTNTTVTVTTTFQYVGQSQLNVILGTPLNVNQNDLIDIIWTTPIYVTKPTFSSVFGFIILEY